MTGKMTRQLSSTRSEALIKVANAVNSTLELDELFKLTLSESIKAITHADGGALFVYEPQAGLLVCRSHMNFDEAVEQIRLSPGESFTGQCFSDRKAILLPTQKEIKMNSSTMTQENLLLLNQSMARHPGRNSFRAMSVPLITARDECIGVVTLNGFAEEGSFSSEDMTLLQAIAGQAATALEKAGLYEDIRAKNSMLEKLSRFHQELLSHMNNGLGLQAMLDQLSSVVGRPLSLLTVYGEVFGSAVSVKDSQIDEFMIRNGRQLLGKLFVYNGNLNEMSTTDRHLIQQSILYFALEINRRASVRNIEQRYKSELVDDLLTGALTDDFLGRAAGLGLDVSGCLLPVAVKIQEPAAENPVGQLIHQNELAGFLEMEIKRRFPGSLVVFRENLYLLLISAGLQSNTHSLVEKLTKIAEGAVQFAKESKNLSTAKFGAGHLVSSLDELADSLQSAIMTLKFMETANFKGLVADSSRFALQRLLNSATDREIDLFISSTLGPVFQYDEEKGTDLARTLQVYCRHLQRPGQAAKELHIHPNTLQYRIKQISRLFGLDFQDSDAMLDVQLACKLSSQS
ncbi:helix-turn-helix domain-containing protein [Edaphobacillus lindanitolerans]|uniref:DNA-binding transcriptional regulator, PucR family n=1 Tax=Edaphobacillus lindanitolerans TaxID=550447 RepID=A0A1U7PPE9_9BACI|nr:helix-turn-helix domain-containing protein [Edaphobacillus lindanitolerans]SIT80128.1 DNA-binding transcriptional regulator, PucR family [Edaphobacillus lindanitolerans]